MSQPENPLNFFRSYSYHHILIACDGTNTAELLVNQQEIVKLQHPFDSGKYTAQKVPGHQNNKYVVVIDGLTDADLSIQQASWETVLIPDTVIGNQRFYNTVEVEGEIIIREFQGVRFLEILTNICDELETDPTGLVFMLKTIFVGIRHDGTSEMITNVRPFLFVPIDITANIDTTGTLYNWAIVGVSNGASKLTHLSAVSDGFSLELSKGTTLKSAMEQLTTAIDEIYLSVKQRLQRELVKRNITHINLDDYRKVNYRIELDEEYQSSRFVIGTQSLDQQGTKGDGDVIITQGDSLTVEHIINSIMLSSQEVINEREQTSNQHFGKKFTFKITSTIDSGPDHYTVVYHVQRYEHVLLDIEDSQSFGFTPPTDNSGLIFDYIFTGKNIDIRNFDIKMEYGLTFLYLLSTSNNISTSVSTLSYDFGNTTTIAGESNIVNPTKKNRIKTPLFPGISVKDIIARNTKNPIDSLTYNSLLSRHAALETIDSKLTITGNPMLLGELNVLPSELSPDSISENGILFKNLYKYPGYIKINIMMPSENRDYAQPFWYRGWYYIHTIKNTFNGGEFIQEIEMFSIPSDSGQVLKNGDDTKEQNKKHQQYKHSVSTKTNVKVKSGQFKHQKDSQPQPDKQINQTQEERKTRTLIYLPSANAGIIQRD